MSRRFGRKLSARWIGNANAEGFLLAFGVRVFKGKMLIWARVWVLHYVLRLVEIGRVLIRFGKSFR